MNYLKRKLVKARRIPKEKIEMYNVTAYLPEDSLISILIDDYPQDTHETEEIQLCINYITPEPQNPKKMYYISVVKVQNNITTLPIEDLAYLCTTSIDSTNFIVLYRITE